MAAGGLLMTPPVAHVKAAALVAVGWQLLHGVATPPAIMFG